MPKKTAGHLSRGQKFAQYLLTELGLGDWQAFVVQTAREQQDPADFLAKLLFSQLLKKVQANEPFTTPTVTNDVPTNAPKVLKAAIKADVDAARQCPATAPSSRL